jgi:hypothetical protein
MLKLPNWQINVPKGLFLYFCTNCLLVIVFSLQIIVLDLIFKGNYLAIFGITCVLKALHGARQTAWKNAATTAA